MASGTRVDGHASETQPRESGRRRFRALTGGGVDGNERLTVLTGLVLIVLLAAEGVTIVRIGQLLWLHLFLGLVLIGPVALKLMSTGYRFVRYYTSNPRYRGKGPPPAALRMLAPLVVLCTLVVFATGVALLFLGPSSRGPLVLVHKVSFIVWLAVTAVHVLGHLPEIGGLSTGARVTRSEINALHPASGDRTLASAPLAGRTGRAASLAAALLTGLVLAVALLGQFTAWTH